MDTPLLLAPMAELSHRPLRELIESFFLSPGAAGQQIGESPKVEYFTEMISAGAFVNQGPLEAWYADNGPCPEKLVYQVVGHSADQIAGAVSLLDRNECLGIDINMGCSAPAITRTGAGVRWMAGIETAAALIGKVRPRTSRRLSVKLRIGLTDDLEYLIAFCRALEEEGIDLITLHPRTAKEKFKRRARWSYICALRKELHIPLAGNGDIASAEEIISRAAECDAVMIGRLALREPWIFAQVKSTLGPKPAGIGGKEAGDFHVNLEEAGLFFLILLSRYQPQEFHISRAKRYFGYFCDNLKWANYMKILLNREGSLSGMERVWRSYFAERPEERLRRQGAIYNPSTINPSRHEKITPNEPLP